MEGQRKCNLLIWLVKFRIFALEQPIRFLVGPFYSPDQSDKIEDASQSHMETSVATNHKYERNVILQYFT